MSNNLNGIEKNIKDLVNQSLEQWSHGNSMKSILISRAMQWLYQHNFFKTHGIEKIQIEENEYYKPSFAKVIPKLEKTTSSEKQKTMNLYLWFPSLPSEGYDQPRIIPADPSNFERPSDLFMMIALDKAYFEFQGLKIFRYIEIDRELIPVLIWSDSALKY